MNQSSKQDLNLRFFVVVFFVIALFGMISPAWSVTLLKNAVSGGGASGYGYKTIVTSDGKLWIAGRTSSGGTFYSEWTDTGLTGVTDAVGVDDYSIRYFYLKSDGIVRDGNGTQKLTGVKEINGTLAIKNDGTLWYYAYNIYNQLTTISNVNTAWSDALYDSGSILVVKNDGSVWKYQSGAWTQILANGAKKAIPNAYVTSSYCSYYGCSYSFAYSSLILKTDGTLWAQGASRYGHLGNGATGYGTLTQIASDVKDFSTFKETTYILKNDGTLLTAGLGGQGHLGNGTSTNGATFTSVLTGVASLTDGMSIVIANDGYVWATGQNDVNGGGLGLGNGLSSLNKWTRFMENFTVSKETSTTSIDLSWTSVPQVTTYEIWRGTGATGARSKIATVSSSTYADTSASTGGVYNYQVKGAEANAITLSDIGLRKYVSTPLTGSGPWSKVAQGSNYTLALQTNGTLWAAGQNGSGQFGNGTTQFNEVYKQVLTGVREVIASGTTLSLAIKTDDTLWAAGGSFGSTWTQIAANVKSVRDGYQYPTIIKNDGSLHFINGTSITQVTGISGVKYATQGTIISYAIKTDDTLWQAGSINGTWSQIKTGVKTFIPQFAYGCGYYGCNYYRSPILLTTSGDVLTSNDEVNYTTTLTGVSAIYGTGMSGSYAGTYALRNDGTLWFTGDTSSGAAGNGSTTTVGQWTQVLDNVASIPSSSLYNGNRAGAVVRSNGTLWLTGFNSSASAYMLGLGDTTNRNVWTQYVVGELTATKGTVSGSVDLTWTDMTGGTGTYQIFRSLGLNGTKAQIATTTSTTYSDTTATQGVTTGAVYGYYVKRLDSTQITNIDYGYRTPATSTITGSGNFTKISAGKLHSLALKSDGRLFAAGANASGQFGDGTATQSKTFRHVLSGVADIIAGTNGVSLVLKTDGTLWAAGTGYSSTWAQILSDVSSIHTNYAKSTFWAIKGGTAYTGTSGGNWAATTYVGIQQITGSYNGSPVIFTLKSDGTVNTTLSGYTASPIGTGFKKIEGLYYDVYSCGYYGCGYGYYVGAIGIKNDNSLWAWGYSQVDGLAGGSKNYTWRKVLENVSYVNSSFTTSGQTLFATKTDGSLWVTSNSNAIGINGDGTSTGTSYWKQIFDNVISTSLSDVHALALRSNGTIWVTGQNASGQHGLNDTTNRTTWTQTGFILPAKVTGVNATDGTQYSKVTVSWTADPDATQYDVFRSTAAGSKGIGIASNVTATSYEDATVSGSTHYFYTIVAKNPVGSGPDSAQNEGYGKVPAVVSSLSATQGTVTDKVHLAWTENPDATRL